MRKFFLILLTISSLIACRQSQERQIQGYVEGENIYLASPYSGILETLAVQRGQMVKKVIYFSSWIKILNSCKLNSLKPIYSKQKIY